MRKSAVLALLAVIVAGCAGRDDVGRTNMQDVSRYSPAEEVIGKQVVDAQGQPVGHVENVVIDQQTDRIGYAVISYGGNLYYVPWSAVTMSEQDRDFLRLSVDRQTVVTSPKVHAGAPLPRETGLQIHRHYGVAPVWTDSVEDRPYTPNFPTGVPGSGVPGDAPGGIR